MKLLTLKESEFFSMVKTIVEQLETDLDQYDDTDFFDAFVHVFRKWAANRLGEEYEKYPFSYLFKEYGHKFLKETFGDKYEQYFRSDDYTPQRHLIPRIGKYLVQIGAHSLPSLRNQTKFTKKYAKHISALLEIFLDDLDFVRPEIKEYKPYDVDVNLYLDYPSYLKSNAVHFNSYNLGKELRNLFAEHLGVEFGNPVHGKVKLEVNIIRENEDSWVKNVLNKQIKKHIREMEGGRYVHSIRFEPKDYGALMKIIYKDYGRNDIFKPYEFRNKVRQYLQDLGYNKITVENA
jgi:hypothetical protein